MARGVHRARACVPRRQPLPPPGRSLRRRCDLGPAAAPGGRRRADPRCPAGTCAVERAGLALAERSTGSTSAVGIHPARRLHGRRRRLGARSCELAPSTRASRRSARPASTTTASSARSRTSWQPAPQPRARARDGQAGDPALPLRRPAGATPRTRSLGNCAAAGVGDGAGGGLRGPAGGDHPLVLRARSTTARRGASTSGSPSASSGLVFRRGEEASRRGRRARAGGPAPGRDRLAVPRAAGRAALAERARVGPRDGALAGRAARDTPEALGDDS